MQSSANLTSTKGCSAAADTIFTTEENSIVISMERTRVWEPIAFGDKTTRLEGS